MIFDIAALIFTLTVSLVMMRRGGMKAIFSLGGLVLSIIVASLLYPVLTDMVYETALPENLEAIVRETIAPDNEPQDENEAIDALPDFMQSAIRTAENEAAEAITTSLSAAVTRVIINIIIFVLLIVVTKLTIAVASRILELATKLPVLKELNAVVGLGCGIVISFVIVWIAVAFTGAVASSNESVSAWIEDSYTVDIMSNINPF
ncbi:MAG: CvpA family protein [Clostridia bacterium]|nr:CvpA family protein [Clostridia bacterium]